MVQNWYRAQCYSIEALKFGVLGETMPNPSSGQQKTVSLPYPLGGPRFLAFRGAFGNLSVTTDVERFLLTGHWHRPQRGGLLAVSCAQTTIKRKSENSIRSADQDVSVDCASRPGNRSISYAQLPLAKP